MNFKELAERTGLEEDEFLELVQDFVDTGNSDLAELRSTIDKGAVGQVVEAAHSLKGAAVSFGFDEIFRVAREVELNARNGVLQGSGKAAQLLGMKLSEIAAAIGSTAPVR